MSYRSVSAAVLGMLVSATVLVSVVPAAQAAPANIASSVPISAPAESIEVSPLATQNFGLTSAEAKNVQRWLKTYWDYTGAIDGELGTNSWKAFQRCLKTYWGYTGAIDGDPGSNTIKALQRLLKSSWGYTGAIDGDAGSGTRAAFKRFANGI